MSLARKTTRGFFWVSLSMLFIKIINFIVTMILARLLDPVHFGLVAIGLVVINFFDLFRDFGVGAALIHRKDDMDKPAIRHFFFSQ